MSEGDCVRTVFGMPLMCLTDCVLNSGLFGHNQAIG